MITITFPDKSSRTYEAGISGVEIAKNISHSLAKRALAVSVNGQVQDLSRKIECDASVEIHTWEDQKGKQTFWHSSAHLLAEALEVLFPDVKFGIGPAIEQGFYYDIDLGDRVLSPEDFPKIEQKMRQLAAQKNTYERKEIRKSDAVAYFEEKGDPYKLELLEGLKDGEITFYQQGSFVDLCKGPHIAHTQYIKAVKLLNVAGAYWRGNEKNPMMTRVYGISFPNEALLKEYLEFLQKAKARDHRKLGKELELFTFSAKVGAGLPLWLPKGAMLRDKLENFLKRLQIEAGYLPVMTPHIGKKDLYITSGHYQKYGKDSFQPITTPHEEEFLLKPMNCPHHCEIYQAKQRSYRDLPLRLAEFGTVYRYEQTGELHGLTRVRGFTQDDAHIFCRKEQLKHEFIKVIDIVLFIFEKLEFTEYTAQLSFRGAQEADKYIGEVELWNRAEREIKEAAQERGLKTVIAEGEAAFYGPKLDFMVKDTLGRQWQLGTIQVDYQLPQRFGLEYVTEDNTKERPVMIHRAPFGSMERFVAILLEHTAGNLPLWLSPIHYVILPISEKFQEYAETIHEKMKAANFYGRIDQRDEKIGRKIRDAEVEKIPLMLIIGAKEQKNQTVTLRRKQRGNLGSYPMDILIEELTKEL